MTPHDHRHQVEIVCPHCGTVAHVPRSMRGGVANCPECGLTVPVRGRFEVEFWMLWGLGVALVVAISWVFFAASGLTAGIVTFLIGMAILGGITLAM